MPQSNVIKSKMNNKVLIIIFAVLFAAIGGIVILRSNASTATISINYYNYSTVSTSKSSGVTTVNDAGAASPFAEVSQVNVGGKLVYDPPASTFPVVKKICYTMRSAEGNLGKTAKVEIMGPDESKTVSLPAVSYYREYCSTSNNLGQGWDAYKAFNVKHISGGPVNVLMTTRYTDRGVTQ